MMRTKQFEIRFLTIFALALFFLGCSKDGADGADGPQGGLGPQGEQGIQGEQGQQGEAGTANVIYSDWIASDFPENINDTFAQWEMYAPELTQEIHDTGVVLVYARVDLLIYSLPDIFYTQVQESWRFRLLGINDELIAIRVHSIDGSSIGEPFLNGDFRYVLIPGGIPSSGTDSKSLTSKVDYTKMSYEEIAKRFNIPD